MFQKKPGSSSPGKTKKNQKVSDSDKALIEETLRLNQDAFARLVNKYKTKIFQLAFWMTRNQETADDLTQETFIKAYTSLGQFKFESSFGTWLTRIALNHIHDHLRKERRRTPLSLFNPQNDIPAGNLAGHPKETGLETQETNRIIQEGIYSLPEKYRVILTLRDLQGFSYNEISRILKISEGTVDSRLFRARKCLKKKLMPFFPSRGGHHEM